MIRILDTVQEPTELKQLTREEIEQVAREMRDVIIETTSANGGHVAPSLGAVEIVLALHLVLDCPRDKVLFDVGHQAYGHKLVTGRRDRFHTLRQYGGLSGFLRLDESEYDAWGAGHGSTSISAALGYAEARDLQGGDETVVAVIGDGAMTGGMALEGLNNAGNSETDLIVILNDNSMSIAPNVGALAKLFAKARGERHYRHANETIKRFTQRLPRGPEMVAAVRKIKDRVKRMLGPGMVFEELGFTYLGPVDGHNVWDLADMLQVAMRIGGPVLIHTVTIKGKGCSFAEADACKFHGISPFDKDTGECRPSSGPPKYSKVFGDTVIELAQQDERIVAITAAMPSGTGLVEFSQRFPDRFFDVGMAEQHAVTFAAGLALGGLRPIVAIYSTFLQRAFDQIAHDVCVQNIPVVFALDRAGLVGDDGATHHGVFDLSYLRCLPNMRIAAPRNDAELRHLLYTAIQQQEAPMAIRYPRGAGLGVGLDEPLRIMEVGRGEELRPGDDITLVGIGACVDACLAAADKLAAADIEAGVIDARWAKPLDAELLLNAAERTGRLVLVEENAVTGGFGSAVLELLADSRVRGVRAKIIGVPDRFIEHGSQDRLRQDVGLDANHLAAAARTLLRSPVGVPVGRRPIT